MKEDKLAIIVDHGIKDEWTNVFRRYAPDIQIDEYPDLDDLSSYTYCFVWMPPKGLIAECTNLKAVFSLGAGVDHILRDETFPRHLPIVRMVNDYLTDTMSEYIVLQCLMHLRRLDEIILAKADKKWTQFLAPKASDVSVGIIGMGILGYDAAKKLKMIGFKVNGYSRTPKQYEGITCFHDGQMDEFLNETDILISLLPLTPETQGICNYEMFKKLRRNPLLRGVVFINAGRGGVHKEADILQALGDGVLYAVSLDVFENEPLPQTSPLWKHPRAFISPHIAAVTDANFASRYVIDMIRHHQKGKKLKNVVDMTYQY